MNCSECERLFDAYLDGQLAGSLRLEFDAHRLRCRRCQQTLAMLETIGNVIASDPQVPELSVSFTDRVMRQIQRSRRVYRPSLRVAVVAGALLQAAAILAFAVLWKLPGSQTVVPDAAAVDETAPGSDNPDRERAYVLIYDGVRDELFKRYASGVTFTEDLMNLARFANFTVDDDLARASEQMAGVNPWTRFWQVALGGEEEEAESTSTADDVHSI